MKKKLIIIIVLLFLGALIWVFSNNSGNIFGGSTTNIVLRDANRVPAKDGANCDITTSTLKTVGPQESTEVLATTTDRSYARISVGDNATNTVFIQLNDVEATVAASPIVLNGANTNGASSTPSIEFGLTTLFPYLGVVEILTDNGTTTVGVIECAY